MQATGKSGRAGIAGFTVVALALLAALAVTQRPLVAGDIFLADQDGRRAALDTQSLDDLAHYKLGELRFQFNPLYQLEPLSPDRLVARNKLNTFFKKQVDSVPHIYFEDQA